MSLVSSDFCGGKLLPIFIFVIHMWPLVTKKLLIYGSIRNSYSKFNVFIMEVVEMKSMFSYSF